LIFCAVELRVELPDSSVVAAAAAAALYSMSEGLLNDDTSNDL
jgi:hypothetical protein